LTEKLHYKLESSGLWEISDQNSDHRLKVTVYDASLAS
ncbi:MAG: hypothetical protein ACD_63C00229G0002, partial [uncultured bacterium]